MCEPSELTTAGEGSTHVVLSNNSCQSLVCYSGGATQAVHDIENLCKIRVSDGTATLPLTLTLSPTGREDKKKIPSPIGDGAICHPELVSGSQELQKHKGQSDVHEMLKQVQHDMNPLPQSFLPLGKEAEKLSSRFTLHSSLKRKAAFTLAEVLVTLGIIGVVAAMTMPVLVAKYQEMVLKNQFKHAYSLVSQAIRQVEANNGYPLACYVWPEFRGGNGCLEYGDDGNCTKWETSATDPYGESSDCGIFQSEFEKTVKIIKVCENNALSQGCIPEYNGADTVKKAEDDSLSDEDINKATVGNSWWRKDAIAKDRKAYVLSDGIILLMSGWSGMRIFAIDVNGKRGPNKWGHDIFAFHVSSDVGGSLNLIPAYMGYLIEKGGKSAKQMLSE